MLAKKHYLLMSIIIGIVILDQITKWVVLIKMPLYESIPIIDNFFSLTHIHNTGGAFGLMANQSQLIRAILFLGLSTLSLGIIGYYYYKTPLQYTWLRVGLALIFAGAIGNLIDRFRIGEVVDFLDFYIGNYHWPAFNVADSSVSIGVVILLYHMIFKNMP